RPAVKEKGLVLPGLFHILHGNLLVERPVVIQHAYQEQAASKEVDDGGDPLAHVQTMGAKDPEKSQRYPGQIEIDPAAAKALISPIIHGRNQEQVDDPADEEQPQSEEVQGAGPGFAIVETVRAHESENPQQVTYGFAV